MINCHNCKHEIKNIDAGCYSEDMCKYFCSLDCFTNYVYEYLNCRHIDEDEKGVLKKQ